MICKICNKEFNNCGFPSHLKFYHNLNTKEYYDKYLKKENEGYCKYCGKPTKFKGLHKGGYFTFCSSTCSAYYTQNKKEVRDKQKITLLNKYGINCALNTCSVEYKMECTKQAVIKKYGVQNIYQSQEFIINSKKKKINDFENFENNNNCVSKTKLVKLYGNGWLQSKQFNIHFIKYKHKNFISNNDVYRIKEYINNQNTLKSEAERQILNTISAIYNKTIILHDRQIIKPKELDFYLPDINLAIEYNSTYYHSIENGKLKDYHLNKSLRCRDLGIRLIHIYEFEDFNEQLQLLNDLLSGIDNYPKNNFNKNNLLQSIPKNGIIYKNSNFTIYGPLY